MDELGTNEAECSKKVASGRRVAGAMSWKLECARVLHESLLVPVLTYIGRRRDVGLDLYRRTTSEVCWVSEEWIKSRRHG